MGCASARGLVNTHKEARTGDSLLVSVRFESLSAAWQRREAASTAPGKWLVDQMDADVLVSVTMERAMKSRVVLMAPNMRCRRGGGAMPADRPTDRPPAHVPTAGRESAPTHRCLTILHDGAPNAACMCAAPPPPHTLSLAPSSVSLYICRGQQRGPVHARRPAPIKVHILIYARVNLCLCLCVCARACARPRRRR